MEYSTHRPNCKCTECEGMKCSRRVTFFAYQDSDAYYVFPYPCALLLLTIVEASNRVIIIKRRN